jgi:hypothetical protein
LPLRAIARAHPQKISLNLLNALIEAMKKHGEDLSMEDFKNEYYNYGGGRKLKRRKSSRRKTKRRKSSRRKTTRR